MKDKNWVKESVFALLLVFLVANGNLFSQSIDVNDLAERMNLEIQKTMIEGKIPSVAVALASGDEIVWTGSAGYSNLWARSPSVPTTVYLIGSTFKTMSTFALLQQMEQGKFKLDDRVNDYLEEFKIVGDNATNPVTFRHLLTHTSGLPEAYGAHLVWGTTVPPSLKDYLSSSLKLQNPPMTKVIYSNMAYTLVAYLIEKFTTMPFAQYIQKHIFDPLEMADTAFMPRPDMEERLAIPYVIDKRTRHHVATRRTKADVWPAGVVYGTVLDQANWLIANLNGGVFKGHRLINEETFHEVMRRQYDQFAGPVARGWLNETTGYGLTWWISERNGDALFAHSGSVSGYTAFIAGNLDKKTGFAILTNGDRSHPHLYKLAIAAIDLLNSKKGIVTFSQR